MAPTREGSTSGIAITTRANCAVSRENGSEEELLRRIVQPADELAAVSGATHATDVFRPPTLPAAVHGSNYEALRRVSQLIYPIAAVSAVPVEHKHRGEWSAAFWY